VRNGKLQVGVIGVGGIARDQHLPAWQKVPFAEVAAVADISEAALQRVADRFPGPHHFTRWEDLLAVDGLDVVDICTPNRTHAPIALAALNQGLHVLCEKPLATSTQEVLALRDASRRAGRVLMTAQHYRFRPISRQLKALIDGGLLGEVYYTRAQYLRRRLLPTAPTFIEHRLSGGGPVYDIGVHILDLACWFLGAPQPVSVSAVVDTRLAHRADLTGSWGDWDRSRFNVEDFAAGFVRFANGTGLVLETSWLGFQPENEVVRLQCYGTRGGLVWPDGLMVGETNRAPWTLRPEEAPAANAHAEAILHFAIAVRDGLPSPVPVEETLQVIRILEGFYRSAQLKKEVALEPLSDGISIPMRAG
jgi:predicted dehydrogenase